MINKKNAYHDDITFERIEIFLSQFELGKQMKLSEINEKLFYEHPQYSTMSSKRLGSYLKKCGWEKRHNSKGNYWFKPHLPNKDSFMNLS